MSWGGEEKIKSSESFYVAGTEVKLRNFALYVSSVDTLGISSGTLYAVKLE